MHLIIALIFGFMFCAGLGCSNQPTRVVLPEVDAKAAGENAVKIYDNDGDGSLSKAELEQCPALLLCFGTIDIDSSESITASEVESRIRAWQDSRAGMVACRLRVMLDGRPLRNASVRLEPVDFMGEGFLSATGTTTSGGYVQLSVAEDHLPAPSVKAVNWGFYDVFVEDGTGSVPGKYRDEKILGLVVEAIGKNEEVVKLVSKG